MKSQRVVNVAALIVLFGSCTDASGLGGNVTLTGPVGWSPTWPKGLKELLGSRDRAGGYFVNADTVFYYAGDTGELNTFLKGYAQLKDTPLRVVLHPGRAKAKAPWKKQAGVSCDWRVSVINRLWRRNPPKPDDDLWGPYSVSVDVWLGRGIELKRLKVPAAAAVKSGGEIEGFVARHAALRERAKPPANLGEFGIDATALRGRPVLLCFWDMEQRASRHRIRELARNAAKMAGKNIAVVTVHARGIRPEALRKWLKDNEVPFPAGQVSKDPKLARRQCAVWGARALPWLILTDTKHVVRTEGFTLGELNEKHAAVPWRPRKAAVPRTCCPKTVQRTGDKP